VQIVVRQVSGLGNQMFQYAAGLYFARRYGAEMKILVEPPGSAVSHGYPRPFLLSNFAISVPFREVAAYDRLIFAKRRELKTFSSKLRKVLAIQEITQAFDQRHTFLKDIPARIHARSVHLTGYWQAHQFADEVAVELRREFQYRDPAQGRNVDVLRMIQQSSHSVSLHIRRGDYTLAAEGNIALPMEYYYQGIRYFTSRSPDTTFFVFSDDINFAKQSLPRDIKAVFVDHNDAFSAHEDLRLMSTCHDHVIANSTFSWWGAWLNPRPHKVVLAPRYWHLKPDSYYPDLFPPDWILLDHRLENLAPSRG
jgi:hypothetical protein